MKKKIEKARNALLDRIIELAPKANIENLFHITNAFQTIQTKPFDTFEYMTNILKELKTQNKKDEK